MDKAQEDSLTERQQYWLDHIRACEASGKSIADYAEAHEINAKTMYAGKKMLVKKASCHAHTRTVFNAHS